MKAFPDRFDEDALASALESHWDFTPAALEYVPLGFSYHWAATDAAGERRFVTVDDLDRPTGLGFEDLGRAFDTASALRDQAALEFVVAPLATRQGQSICRLDSRYTAALFPWVEGTQRASGQYATAEERGDVVRLLVDLHRATPVVRGTAPARDWKLSGRASLEAALRDLDHEWQGGPFSEPTRALLARHVTEVRLLLDNFDRMAGEVHEAGEPLVVTHGEPKSGNIIRGRSGPVMVDWDTVAIAPPERDLWLVDDGSGDQLRMYADAIGRKINRTALELYRLAWDLADLFVIVNAFRSPHTRTTDAEADWAGLGEILAGRAPLTA
jgi:spectinomycin phosphotransferase